MADKKQKKYFGRWYEKHGDKLNEERRRRYQEDPEYAARVREQNRTSRSRKKKESTGQIFREYEGKQVEVFRIGAAAEQIGLTPMAIHNWEALEQIPKPIFPGSHRLYTQHQIDLLKAIAEAESMEERQAAREQAKQKWYSVWNG